MNSVLVTGAGRGIGMETARLFLAAGWRVLAPAEADLGAVTVIEGSRSYLENATAKAVAYERASGLAALADDSGLEVDALDGGPGVLSARFGGPAASTDRERCALLLRRLRGLPRARRGARFRAVLVLALPGGASFAREGAVEGRISEAGRGESGFGYAPVFELPDGRTMAELGEEKQHISHRARALSAMMEVLEAVDDPQHPPAVTAGARR